MAKNLPMKKTIIATLVVASVASLSLIAGNGVADTVDSVNKLNTVVTGTITTASNSSTSTSNSNTTTNTTVSSASANAVGPVSVSKVSMSNIGQPLRALVYLNKDVASASFSNGTSNSNGITLSLEKMNDREVIILKTVDAYNEALAHVTLSVTDLEGKVSHLSVTLAPAIPASVPVAQAAPISNVNSTANNNASNDSDDTDAPVIHKKKHKVVVNTDNTGSSSSSNTVASTANTSALSADAAFVYKKLQAQQERTVELAKQYQDTLNQQLNLLQKQKKDLSSQEQTVDSKITELQQKIDEANTNLSHIVNNSNAFTSSVNNTVNPTASVSATNTTTINTANSLPAASTPASASNVNSNSNTSSSSSNNSIAPTIVSPVTPAPSVHKDDSKVVNTNNNTNVKPKFNIVIPNGTSSVVPSSTNSTAPISDKALLEGTVPSNNNANNVKLSDKDKATINQSLNLPSTPNAASSTSMADLVASQVVASNVPASSSAASDTSLASSTSTNVSNAASSTTEVSGASGALAASAVKPKHPIKKHHVAQPKPVVEDKSFLDTVIQGVMDNILYVGGGIVVIVLLGLFSVVRKKANKNKVSS